MNNPSLITASLSHYVAEKEKTLAELEVCLNRPVALEQGNIVDKVILLFKKLNDVQGTIELITGIIEENKKQNLQNLEQLDKAKIIVEGEDNPQKMTTTW